MTVGRWIPIILQLVSWSGLTTSEGHPKIPLFRLKIQPSQAFLELLTKSLSHESPYWASAP